MKRAPWTIGLLIAFAVIERVHIELLRHQRDKATHLFRQSATNTDTALSQSHEWEQRWRDCQAALSMLRTPHPADAVNDVTMP